MAILPTKANRGTGAEDDPREARLGGSLLLVHQTSPLNPIPSVFDQLHTYSTLCRAVFPVRVPPSFSTWWVFGSGRRIL